MHSLGKTLLDFALLHSVLQGQICPLLQVFLDFLLHILAPYNDKDIFFGVLVLEDLIGFHTTIQLQLLQHYWLGADCGSDHDVLIAKFTVKMKKVGKTTRPFRYDRNQIPLITQWSEK